MAAETKAEQIERLRLRLAELQAQEWEAATVETFLTRCSPEDAAKIETLTESQLDALAKLAAEYIVQDECPDCGAFGSFAWGIVHGSGYCYRCYWPGTAYHFLTDPDPQAPCRECEKPPAEHVEGHRSREPRGDSEEWTDETYLKCPGGGRFSYEYRPRKLCKLVLLLWAHPSRVETD